MQENFQTVFSGLPSLPTCRSLWRILYIRIAFVNDVIPGPVLGFNAKDMEVYVRYVGDTILFMLGYSKIYNVANPLDSMDLQSLERKTNFFERRVSEYKKNTEPRVSSLEAGF